MNILKKASLVLIFAFSVLSPSMAFAIDLDTAKSQKLVGETPSGYLAPATASPSADVKKLVADINAQRRAAYQNIANSNGTSISDVEKLAGQKAINNTAPGNLIQTPSGSWASK
jgi:uncharacterized protein YdbL (DUF1318 family)